MAINWTLDQAHSEVQFKIKHLVISTVSGFFQKFEGKAVSEGDDFENAEIDFSLDVNSISTNNEQRDEHLKGADFFDTAQYPQIIFKSTSMQKGEGGAYALQGDLTIKGVTRQITLKAEYGGSATDFYGNMKAGFEVSGSINRRDFGLTWSGITDAGSVVVGEDVKLNMNVQFTKQA